MSNQYKTIEERIGRIYGILEHLPNDINELFGKVNAIDVEQARLHAEKQGEINRLKEDVESLTKRREQKDYDTRKLYIRVHDVEKYIHENKNDKTFWKHHIVNFVMGLVGAVTGSLIVWVVTNS